MKEKPIGRLGGLAAALGAVFGQGAAAQGLAEQALSYEVVAINEISVAGDPGTMRVRTAEAGSPLDAVTSASASYALTTNGTAKKLTAAIDSDMPAGVTLSVRAAAPSGAASLGKRALSGAPVDLVTGIGPVAETGLLLEYEVGAEVTAGVLASALRTVTLTIADEGGDD